MKNRKKVYLYCAVLFLLISIGMSIVAIDNANTNLEIAEKVSFLLSIAFTTVYNFLSDGLKNQEPSNKTKKILTFGSLLMIILFIITVVYTFVMI